VKNFELGRLTVTLVGMNGLAERRAEETWNDLGNTTIKELTS